MPERIQLRRVQALTAGERFEAEYKLDVGLMLEHMDEFIDKLFGERCSEFEPDCPTCKLWKLRDEFKAIVE